MAGQATKDGSVTTPATSSTTSSLSSIKSRRVLVYDMAENTTRKMSRSKFENLYSDVPTDCISIIPLPKGASDIDISPDDLRCHSLEATRSESPEQMEESESPTESRSRPYSVSYRASVHIPSSVFYTRMIAPSRYTDLIIVSRPTLNSQKSSRSNTSQTNAELEE